MFECLLICCEFVRSVLLGISSCDLFHVIFNSEITKISRNKYITEDDIVIVPKVSIMLLFSGHVVWF